MKFKTILTLAILICFSYPSFAQQNKSSPCADVFKTTQRWFALHKAGTEIAYLEEKKCLGTISESEEVKLEALKNYINQPGGIVIANLIQKDFLGTITEAEKVKLKALLDFQGNPGAVAIADLKVKEFLGTLTDEGRVRLKALIEYADYQYVVGIANIKRDEFNGRISKSDADKAVDYLANLGRRRKMFNFDNDLYIGPHMNP